MAIEISPNLPANVVEIGNEITQTKINEINSGTLATQTWVSTSYAPKASPTFTGTVTIPAGANISGYALKQGTDSIFVTGNVLRSVDGGGYFAQLNGGNLQFGYDGSTTGIYITSSSITFADNTTQTTAPIPDAPSDGFNYARNNGAWVQL